jgi:hypothetical protein
MSKQKLLFATYQGTCSKFKLTGTKVMASCKFLEFSSQIYTLNCHLTECKVFTLKYIVLTTIILVIQVTSIENN